jgi:hypothetical protein
VGLVWLTKLKILYLNKLKFKIMSIAFIIGWLFMIITWIPKPFIKDERKCAGVNLVLAAIALGIFIADYINYFNR